MIEIDKIDSKLVLKYYSERQDIPWIEEKFKKDGSISIQKVFRLKEAHLLKKEGEFDEFEYYFQIGELINDYYKIDKDIFALKHNFFFHEDIDLHDGYFVVTSKISLLRQVDRLINQDIYIGGDNEDILPHDEFLNLIKIFPTSHEINLYRQAKVTSILKNYFDNIKDQEEGYKTYINKKTPVYNSELRKMFQEDDILKYETLLEKLQTMLSNKVKYSEDQWQEEIIQIILLLFPKYVAVFDEVRFKDIDNKTRRLDYGLIDFMGNLDLIEIKIPFDGSIVSVGKYRDNHIPKRDLSGAIMQIEKYIYYLNKTGTQGERNLTKKYKDTLPEGLEIKITNPNGMIIMGRDTNLTKRQLADFEIIKRKYKNIIDIFTYDDLLRRLELTIKQLKQL